MADAKGADFDCPNCRERLVMTERAGVEIDYCPKCRGVWLDRGELDKIVERAVGEAALDQPARNAPPPPPPSAQPAYRGNPHDSDYGRPYDPHYGKGHKRKHWLAELFD